MLMEKTVGANGMIRELYVTISVYRKNVEDARNYFLRTGNGLISHFSNLGSKCEEPGRTGKTSCTVQLLPGRRGKSFLF